MANTTGKKFGGREKGTPNKLTKELRSALKDVLFGEVEHLLLRQHEIVDHIHPSQTAFLIHFFSVMFENTQIAEAHLTVSINLDQLFNMSRFIKRNTVFRAETTG